MYRLIKDYDGRYLEVPVEEFVGPPTRAEKELELWLWEIEKSVEQQFYPTAQE